jgi:anti-anti-sigma factor
MLEIKMRRENDVAIVEMSGVIGAQACRQFEEAFDRLIETGCYKIIVDLSGVDYMTAVGAGIFMAIHNVAQANQGDVILVHPKRTIDEVFNLIGLKKMITVVPDKETALRKLAPRPAAR